MTDEEFVAEIRRRLAEDNGVRYDLADVIKQLGFTEEELAEDEEDE